VAALRRPGAGRAERGPGRPGPRRGHHRARYLGAVSVSFTDVLWLALIGWFIITAATTERQTATAELALAGVRVADVMTAHPDLASGWHSVADFTGEAARSRQDGFPVVDFNGGLTGIVLTSQLAASPRGSGPACGWTRSCCPSRLATGPSRVIPPLRWSPGFRSVARSPRWSWPMAGWRA